MAEPASLQDILRRRQRARFVGRDDELALFRKNFHLPAEHEQKRFLFNIHGDGGVGKSFLVGQLRRISEEEGATVAYTDEDSFGVPETMAALAGQLGKPLQDFLDRYDAYARRREQMAQDPQAPLAAWSRVTRSAVKIGLHASKAFPGAAPIVDLVDADAVADAADQVRIYVSGKFSDSRDVRLLLNPVEELSPEFVRGLRKAGLQQPIALFFDTYERTASMLDGWLLGLLAGHFGPLPAATTMTIAGRNPLGATGWSDYLGAIASIPLSPFSEIEMRQLLASKGITAEPVIQAVWALTGGLPLLVAMLAENQPQDSADMGDPSGTAIERFLKWEHDPQRREAVLSGALSRQVNADVLAVLDPDSDGKKTLDWIRSLPFVVARSEGFIYHEVVRTQMVRMRRTQSIETWRESHRRLAEAHRLWRRQVNPRSDWSDTDWLHHRTEETYHQLCAEPSMKLASALELTVRAAIAGLAAARRWVETIHTAGLDAGNERILRRAEQLLGCLDEEHSDCTEVLTALLDDEELGPNTRILAHVERGRLLYLANRAEDAIADFSRAIQLKHDHAEAFARRGQAQRSVSRFSLALADFNRAIEIHPNYPSAIANRGLVHMVMKRFEEGLADFDRALELDNRYAFAFASRGDAYRTVRQFELALPDLDRAIAIDPQYAWAIACRADTYRALKRYDEALSDLDRAIEIDQRYAFAFASRGDTYRMMKEYEKALADLDRAVESKPRHAFAFASRGVTYRAMNRYEEALSDLNHAIEINQQDAFALAGRGETYRLMKRFDDALLDFDRSIALEPRSAWTLASRGETLWQMKRYKGALKNFNRAVDLDPNSSWIRVRRGRFHRATKRLAKSLDDLKRAVELDPDSATAVGGRGETYRHLKQYGNALKDFERALELSPDEAWIVVSRGQTYRALEQYEEALDDFNRGIELDPDLAWAFAGRGEAYRLMGKHDRAFGDLSVAIELDSSEAWYFACRSRISREQGSTANAEADLERARQLNPEQDWSNEEIYQGGDAP